MRKLLESAMAEQETVILEITPVLRRTLGDRRSLPPARFISTPLAGASLRRKTPMSKRSRSPSALMCRATCWWSRWLNTKKFGKGICCSVSIRTLRYCPEAGQSSFGLGAADYRRPREISRLAGRDARARPGYRNTAKPSTSGKDET